MVAILLALPAFRLPFRPAWTQAAPGPTVTRITTLKESGGRVDWSPWNVIAFDQLGADNYFDVFTMNPDGSNERCLTCNRPELPNRHIGNPAWHPSGAYIVFQSQKANAPANPISDYFANPGSGINNDLWLMDSGATRFWRLTDVPLNHGGVLHPHFSNQGDKLVWTERLTAQGGPIGQWALKLADFRIVDDTPRIENVRTYQPGAQFRFYETHGFTPDGRKLLFSGNLEPGQSESGGDIYTGDLITGQVTNLTSTLTEWDEHARNSPGGGWIAWMSSMGPGGNAQLPRSDFWLMRADGSSKRQVTFFNQAGRPEHIPGGATAADSSWSPDGTRLLGYVIRDFTSGTARLVMIEFSGPVDTPKAFSSLDQADPGGTARAVDTATAEQSATATHAVQIALTSDDLDGLRNWDETIDRMVRDRRLSLVATTADPFLTGRQHERFVQLHDGHPVYGGELVRQRSGTATVSIVGTLFPGARVETTPLGRAEIPRPSESRSGPNEGERYRLPTYDMRENARATLEVLSPTGSLEWIEAFRVQTGSGSDPIATITEAHIRTTLEYLEQRFGRNPFYGSRAPISLLHPDEPQTTARLPLFSKGPFYAGRGVLVFPDPPVQSSRSPSEAAVSLRSVAHALGHALVDATSRLYRNESGALNEALAQVVSEGTESFSRTLLGQGEPTVELPASGHASHLAPAGDPARPSLALTAASVLAVVNGVLNDSQAPGPASRAEVEKVFLRAFTLMLPSDANLHQARVVTLQSARDLSGSQTALESRLARAWASIGIK